MKVEDYIKRLPKSEQKKIYRQTKILIQEEKVRKSLAELRKALNYTQPMIADQLGVTQSCISKQENRDNQTIDSVRNYIEALGGELKLVVKFPNRLNIELKL